MNSKKYVSIVCYIFLSIILLLLYLTTATGNSSGFKSYAVKLNVMQKKKAYDDKTIISNIKKKILASRMFLKQSIEIFSNQGAVTVKGTVNTFSEATELVRIIETVPGVRYIDVKQLKIKHIDNPKYFL